MMDTNTSRKIRNRSFEKMPPRWLSLLLKAFAPSLLFGWIDLAQALCRVFRQRPIKIYFLNAIGLAPLLDNGKNLNMPVVVTCDRAPILAQFSLSLKCVGRGVQHHVITF